MKPSSLIPLIVAVLLVAIGGYMLIRSGDAEIEQVDSVEAPVIPPSEVEATSTTPTVPPRTSLKPCYVGGCSGQLCSDTPGMASNCEFRPEYACYKNATCERQSNGQCGWTETALLRACIAAPSPL